MNQEKMRILRMLEQGKITADDAANLLDAAPCDGAAEGGRAGGKKIRVRVTDPRTGKQTANLTVPASLAKFAMQFIPAKTKQELADRGINIEHILSQVMTDNTGKIVDVESEEANVQVFIE